MECPNKKEKRRLYHKEYSLKNSEKLKAAKREWKLKNYNENSGKYKNYEREWRIKNPLKAKVRDIERNNRKVKAMPKDLSKENIEEIKNIYLLAKNKSQLADIRYNVDHIIPLKGRSVCGLHVPWNLRVITEKENKLKSNKIVGN